MILLRYFFGTIVRFSSLIGFSILSLFWISEFTGLIALETTADGSQFSQLLRVLVSLSLALPAVLELSLVILMLSAVIAITLISRRAELHILKGASLSEVQILSLFAAASALIAALLVFIVQPAVFEFEIWGKSKAPSSRSIALGEGAQSNVYWYTADEGALHGVLFNLSQTDQSAIRGLVFEHGKIERGDPALNRAISWIRRPSISGDQVLGTRVIPGEDREDFAATLTQPPARQLVTRASKHVPLFHALQWLPNDEALNYIPRQRSFVVHSNLAQPLLTAALVFLAGTLCVGIGTRQSIGTLVFGTLSLVVLSYSLSVLVDAFGLNGKLSPWLAAWGPPMLLICLGFAVLMVKDARWLFTRQDPKPEKP